MRRPFASLVLVSAVACVFHILMWVGSIRLDDLVVGKHWEGDAEERNGHYELDTDLPALFRYGWPLGRLGKLPYWIPALVFSVLPSWWLVDWVRQRRANRRIRASRGRPPADGA